MREQRYHGHRKGSAAGLAAVATGAAVAWWWSTRRPFRVAVEGLSMLPSLMPGDFLVATAPRRLVRGGVVVLEHPARPGFELVKRLTAVPGDRTVDGRVLEPGEYWVEGRGVRESADSRTFGPVSASSIVGVVRFRYWPPGRAGPVR